MLRPSALAVLRLTDELEFRRMLDRDVGGLRPPQYLIGKVGG
jgi:hypothetical protein